MSRIAGLLTVEQRYERMVAELRALLLAMETQMVDPMEHSRRLREIVSGE
jgi:hypothetical protein